MNIRLDIARIEYGQGCIRNELPVIDQGYLIGRLESIWYLTICHDVNVPMLREELVECPQAESQLVVVAVPPFNIAKLGET